MDNSQNRENNPHWQKFLKTGRIEDYLNFKIQQNKHDVEFAREIDGEINGEQILRNRIKSD